MGDRKNKISQGLSKLLNSKKENSFSQNPDVFVGDPNVRNNYFDMFYQAQLTEIACSGR